MYKKIDQKDIAYLSSLVDEKSFFYGEQIAEDFSKDELGYKHVNNVKEH